VSAPARAPAAVTPPGAFTRPLPPLRAVELPDDPPPAASSLLGLPRLPAWLTAFRDDQWDAITAVVGAFHAGARVVLLDAPTGSGKTVIGETVRRLLGVRGMYVCSTKSLQDQFAADFGYAAVLKGRANYPTELYPERFADRFRPVTCADCMAAGPNGSCPWCESRTTCPYQGAKRSAIAAPVACTNTAYYLSECNGPGGFAGRPFCIVDEADTFESTLMGAVEVSISPSRARRMGLAAPDRKTVEESWRSWVADQALPRTRAYLARLADDPDDVEILRERTATERLLRRLLRLARELDAPDVRWVYDGYQRDHIVFRPVRVDRFGPALAFRHADRWLLMSATLIEPTAMCESLGIPASAWACVAMGSTFPPDRRPVRVAPIASMTRKNEAEAWPKVAAAVARIVGWHPGERVLVHSVSYALTEYLVGALQAAGHGARLVTYSAASERDDALRLYRATPGAVMVAPSLDRGIDLPGELCRVQVVVKVPFPNLGDKQVNARLYSPGGDLWYRTNTVRTLVQMTGRGMRSAGDSCVTYLLDEQFASNVWRKSRRLLPRWWTDALDFDGRWVRELTEPVPA